MSTKVCQYICPKQSQQELPRNLGKLLTYFLHRGISGQLSNLTTSFHHNRTWSEQNVILMFFHKMINQFDKEINQSFFESRFFSYHLITSSIVIIAINITNNNNPPPSSSGVVLGRAQMWMDSPTPARVAVSCSSPWINKPPNQKSVSEGIEDKTEKETFVF